MTNSPTASADAQPARQHFVIDPALDPRDVFMSAQDIHDYLGRYLGRGRTQGYLVTSGPAFQLYQAEPGRWRLCDIRRYSDDKVEAQVSCICACVASSPVPDTGNDGNTAGRSGSARARRSQPAARSDNPFRNSTRRSNAPGTKKGSAR